MQNPKHGLAGQQLLKIPISCQTNSNTVLEVIIHLSSLLDIVSD